MLPSVCAGASGSVDGEPASPPACNSGAADGGVSGVDSRFAPTRSLGSGALTTTM